MSHRATNWAIQQRGLKPAARVVLWHLADRHNSDTRRCDPSQALLAHDCELSRSALNTHLKALEAAGLIRREARIDPVTKRRKSTAYLLAFDHKFDAPAAEQDENQTQDIDEATQDVVGPCPETGHGKPCPENGDSRVQNPDTNPVREPIPPLPPEGGGNETLRLEGFDLFLSVWPENWPGVDDNPGKLRGQWRRAVDQHGAETVLASARNYLAKTQALIAANPGTRTTKASVGWFLTRKSGLIGRFIPADAPAVTGPVDLGTGPQHEFLALARGAGVDERHIRHWAPAGKFVIKPCDAGPDSWTNKVIGVDGDLEAFKSAFAAVAHDNRMAIYNMAYALRLAAKASERRAG